MKFCPKCGKKGIEGDFCSSCAAEMSSSVLESKEIRIRICPICMTYFYRNSWVKFDDLNVVVRKIAKDSLKKRVNADINPLLPEIEYKSDKKYDAEVEVALSSKEKYFIPAVIEMVKCKRCGKSGSEYFEGVLQLRNPNKEVIRFIREDVAKQRGKGIFITNEEDAGDGIDFYITSQKYIQNLGSRLQHSFGGILKITSKIFTRNRQTSRDVYRVNAYFELLAFNVGDMIVYDGKILKVTSISKQVSGTDIMAGKKVFFSPKEKVEILKKEKATVIKVYPHIEVMNPETYQPVKVENKKKVENGEKVIIAAHKGRFYIV